MIAVGRQRAVRFLCGLPSAGRLGALSADRQALREKKIEPVSAVADG